MGNNIEFGVNIIEIITKGLYTNSLDIFREYIQNSCDAIDDAFEAGILAEDEELIEIEIDAEARKVTIQDNGAGIPTKDFERIMRKIGNSDKTLDKDRGFRGIGRLCGLAYCREARFISTVKGETKLLTMIIAAERLRQEFFSDKKLSAESVLRDVITFDRTDTDADEHFFRVELIDIVDTNNDLLDVFKVRDYLSFVAPVTYSSNFYYKTEIYKHAAALNFKITEYKIQVNGEPIVKNYKTMFNTTHNGKDEIFDVAFRDFYDDEGNFIAWSWIGLSQFKGVLDQKSGTSDNMMRGIRLRAGNIQIGDAGILKKLFSEERGTNYFIGEVHTADTNLRPNSRRDYFEENEACNILEIELKKYFVELYEMYHTASDLRSAYTAIKKPDELERDFQSNSVNYQKTNRAAHEAELTKLKKIAQEKERVIKKLQTTAEQSPETALSRVILRFQAPPPHPPTISRVSDEPEKPTPNFPPSTWRKDTRRLYNKIEVVILNNPKLAGKNLLDKIKTELAK